MWHAAGRASRDGRKRAVALVGLGWSAPVLVLGAFLTRLVSEPASAFEGLTRPFAFVLGPLADAYWASDDLGLIGYLLLQILLLTVLWGYYGGRIHRQAIVELGTGNKEDLDAAARFAGRSWRTFSGARLTLWIGFWAPLAGAVALAMAGRLDGWIGGVLLVGAVVAMVAAALVAVLIGSVALMGGFLTGPIVAAEDSDVFDAVTRTFTYVGSGLPRLCALRARFLFGVLLGSGWRFLKTALVAALSWGGLHLGAGPERLDRAAAIVKAMGVPHDAQRLGLGPFDYILAGVLILALLALLAFWLADLVTRVICARSAVYLLMRQDVDRVPLDTLRLGPQGHVHQSADEAGFVEVQRIGSAS